MATKQTLELRAIKPISTFLGKYKLNKITEKRYEWVRDFQAGAKIASRDNETVYLVALDGSFVRLT